MSDKKSQTTADDTANLSLGQSALVGAAGKFLLALFGFAGVVYFYRDLGPATIGAYYTVVAGMKIATSFQNAITGSVEKRVSEVNADQSAYLGIGVLSWIATTLGAGLIVLAVAPFTDQFGVSIPHLLGGVAMLSSLGLFSTINQFYVGIGNPGKSTWIDAIRSLLTLAGQLLLVLGGFGEFGLMGGFVFGSATTAVGLFVVVGILPSFPSRHVVTRTFDFAKWSFPNGLGSMVYDRMDQLILSHFLGPTAVGFYQPALQLAEPATFVSTSISQSTNVKSSGIHSQGGSILPDIRNGLAYSGLIAIPLFFGALALPAELMGTIFGPSATAGAGALIGLSLLKIFRSFSQPLGSVTFGLDRFDLRTKITYVIIIVKIPLAILLTIEYGLIGVVVAAVVAELLKLLLSLAITIHLIGFPGIPREVIEQLFAAVLMFGAIEVVLASTAIRITSVYLLLLVVGGGAAVYFLALIAVSRKFRNTTQIVVRETLPF